MSPLLTTREVAALLGLSPATVLRRWRAGELPGYRLGSNVLRFDAADIAAWLESRRLEVGDMQGHRGPRGSAPIRPGGVLDQLARR